MPSPILWLMLREAYHAVTSGSYVLVHNNVARPGHFHHFVSFLMNLLTGSCGVRVQLEDIIRKGSFRAASRYFMTHKSAVQFFLLRQKAPIPHSSLLFDDAVWPG